MLSEQSYKLSQSIVREQCEFWSQSTTSETGPHDSNYEILNRQVCAQRGFILHYYEDNQRSGVAIAAFPSGIHVFKTRGSGPYALTAELSWEVLEHAKTEAKRESASTTKAEG